MNEALVWHGRVCQKCGLSKNIEVHHIVAVIEGGNDAITNLSVLCRSCHSEWHHAVELAEEDHQARRARFDQWLTIPPTWFFMAYVRRHGLGNGTFDEMVETFRAVQAVNKAAQANVSQGEMQYYLDQMRDHEQTTRSNAILIGLEMARKKGVKLGRPPTPQKHVDEITRHLLAGKGVRETARLMHVSAAKVTEVGKRLRESGVLPVAA